MELTIIDNDRDSQVSYNHFGKSKRMTCTLRPICLAHEISHIRLGHITGKEVSRRNASFDNLILQELDCWRYVFSLQKWDTKEMKFARSCLENTINTCGISVRVLVIYQEFKAKYSL